MRWITLILVTCLLLAGTVSCTASSTSNPEMYQYYMQIAQQYDTAAAAEDSQAEYYANLAQVFKEQLSEFGEQEYEEMMAVSQGHQESAEKYRAVAKQHKETARQYR